MNTPTPATPAGRPASFECPRCGCVNCRGCYCHEDPFEHLVAEALHLLVNGERAPGGDETWAAWATSAETQLRHIAVVAGRDAADTPQ